MEMVNIYGVIIVVLMLIPNIVYAIKVKNAQNLCKSKVANITEQVGRYGSMFLMVFSVGIFDYGWSSNESFAIWLILQGVLMLLYYIFWIIFIFKKHISISLMLAIIPSVIFIYTGISLRHILQIIVGVIFAVAHIYITYVNNREET